MPGISPIPISDENKSREQLLKELADLRASLEAKERHCQELSRELSRFKSKELPEGGRKSAAELEALMDAFPAVTFICRDPGCLKITGSRLTYEIMRVPQGTNISIFAPAEEGRKQLRFMRSGCEIPPEELPIQKATSTGQPVRDYEFDVVYEDGTRKTLLGNAVPLINPQGSPYGAVSAFIDITDRKKAEAALRESEEKFRSLFENSLDGVLLTHPDSAVTAANPAACAMLGWSEKEICQMGRSGTIDTSDSRFPGLLEERRRTGRVHAKELTAIRKNGERFPVEIDSVILPGEHGQSFVIMRDITDRKQAEESLRESEERFRLMFDQAPIGAALVDLNLKFIQVNTQLCRFLGYSEEELLELQFPDFTHPEDLAQDLFQARRMLAGEIDHYELEKRFVRKNGRIVWGHISVRAMKDARNRPVYFLPVLLDITARKQAEEALREREEEFSVLVENAPDVISLFDRNLRRIYVNSEIRDNTGQDASFMKGKSLTEAGYPDRFAQPLNAALQKVFATGREETVELDYEAPAGLIWLQIRCAPLRSADGSVERVMSIGRDITDRKHVEEALRESESRYRSLFQNMSEGFALHEIITDNAGHPIDYRFLEVNPAFERLTGLEREDLVGRRVLEVLPATEPSWIERYGRVALAGEIARFEEYSGGLDRWYEVFAFQATARQFAVIFSDITERKREEERARRDHEQTVFANRLLRVFVEHEGDELFDRALTIILEEMASKYGVFGYIIQPGHLICPSLSKMLDACEIEGKCIHYPPEKWKGFWARALMEKRSLYTNDASPVPPGHTIIHNNLATPILFQGEAIGLLNLANKEGGYTDADRDVLDRIATRIAPLLYTWIQRKLREDERLQAEEALQKAHDHLEMRVRERTAELARSNSDLMEYAAKLERLNKELEDFAFIASHDLREPLRKIQIFGSRLQDIQSTLSERPRDDLMRIIKSSRRMDALVKALKDYSGISRGMEGFEYADLTAVAKEAASDLEIALHEAGGRVEIESLPFIKMDRVKMRQLFQNLIGNAIKYARGDVMPVIRIAGTLTAGVCRIFVEDNGIGFDEAYGELIFKPFKRLHGKESSYEGTGMGLAICRKVVEMHGGEITARSTPGKGSTFIIHLPVPREGAIAEKLEAVVRVGRLISDSFPKRSEP